LEGALRRLLADADERQRMAVRAKNLIAANGGSVDRLLSLVESRL
jgi:3-deoxy-D-manno-octulosonic-acid transferase